MPTNAACIILIISTILEVYQLKFGFQIKEFILLLLALRPAASQCLLMSIMTEEQRKEYSQTVSSWFMGAHTRFPTPMADIINCVLFPTEPGMKPHYLSQHTFFRQLPAQ